MDVLGHRLAECPAQLFGEDARALQQIVVAAELAERGMWPAPGPWGEQAAACVDGVRAVWAVEAAIERRQEEKRAVVTVAWDEGEAP